MTGKMTKEQEDAVNRVLMAKRDREETEEGPDPDEAEDEEDAPPKKKSKGLDLNALVGDLDVPSLVEGFTKDQEETGKKLDLVIKQNASIETKLTAIAAVLKQIVPLLEKR